MISNPPIVHPAIHLLGSPTHLLFQLIKLTTVPYMVYQIINHNKTKPQTQPERKQEPTNHSSSIFYHNRPFKSSSATLICKPLQPSHIYSIGSINRSFSSDSSQTRFGSSLVATSLFHDLIRHPNLHNQLIHQLDLFLELSHPPKLHSKTVDHLFFITRHCILDRLTSYDHHLKVRTSTSIAWQAEASSQIVQRWHIDHQSRIHSKNPTSDVEKDHETLRLFESNPKHHDLELIKKLRRLRARHQAFLSNGPPTCACQRSILPPKPIDLDRVGSLLGSTLGSFATKLHRSITTLTLLRMIDIARQAQRWDLVVILLDRTQIGYRFTSRLNHRRLGQITGLLEFLRHHRSIYPEIDPIKIWSVNFICESIERSLLGQDCYHQEWVRINRLSLDVLARFATLPIGIFPSKHNRNFPPNSQKVIHQPAEERWPLLDLRRHRRLLDSIGTSVNELEFAVKTRERCERLLSKLARIASYHSTRSGRSSHSWSCRSVLQLRLLEYLARQGTEDQFMSLLKTHLDQHATGPKLARIILLGARRFKRLSENPELIKQTVSRLDLDDHRPLIDFMLRPNQPIEVLNQNLEICLDRLPIESDKRIRIYSHLIYRLSQLPTPSLALKVWEIVNRERSRRLIRGVGRRTRLKWSLLLKSENQEKSTQPLVEIPNQLIRSMVYVFRNLTHSSPTSSLLKDDRNLLAIGKNYRVMYQRLAFKSSNRTRVTKWPISRSLARSHLIFDLIKAEVKRLEDSNILRSLENSLIAHLNPHGGTTPNHHDHFNCFEGLIKRLLLKKIEGSELNLIKRFDGLEMMTRNQADLLEGAPSNPSFNNLSQPNRRLKRLRRKLKFYRFLNHWIKSRGFRRSRDQSQTRPMPLLSSSNINPQLGAENLPNSTAQPFSSQGLQTSGSSFNLLSLSNSTLHHHRSRRRPRRRSCSRYWARIVAQESIPTTSSSSTYQ